MVSSSKRGGEARALTRYNGVLAYGILANGKVAVWIEAPRVEEILEPHERQISLVQMEPSDIDEEAVLDHAEEFFVRINKAATGSYPQAAHRYCDARR